MRPSPNGSFKAISTRRIMGIDPGLSIMGVGVIDQLQPQEGQLSPLQHIYHGLIQTPAEKTLTIRLSEIRVDFQYLIKKFSPTVVAMEEYFASGRPNANGFNVAKVIGVLGSVCGDFGIPLYLYPSSVLKKVACDKHKAEKKDVQEGVQLKLEMVELPKPSHSADALAAALCYVAEVPHLNKTQERV